MQSEESNTLVKLAKAVIEHAPEGADAFWDIKFSDIEAALSAAEPVKTASICDEERERRLEPVWYQNIKSILSGLTFSKEVKMSCLREFEAFYASALSAQVQDVAGWQPIETAPKDGSKFIGFDGRRPFLCYTTKHYVKYPHEEGGPTFRDVWSGDYYDCISPEHPTHWMPLPAAPAKQEG